VGGTLAAAEAYRHPFLTARGTSGPGPVTGAPDGLRIEGDGVTLIACRRRGEWLELRLVNESGDPGRAVIDPPVGEAREADLLGRPGAPIPGTPGAPLAVDLAPWEIRTMHVRDMSRPETGSVSSR